MIAIARGPGWLLSLAMLLFGACSDTRQSEGATPALERSGRFGSLRDLVLFDRAVDGQPFRLFLDRFEVTRADWREFAATEEGRQVQAADCASGGDPALPASAMDLRQARAFARWRFARLPRAAEWFTCVVGDGRNRFPWGSKEDPTRTNTGELGLGEPTPVGTFESGRRTEGKQPYDLIGNVSEWTETVPPAWCLRERTVDPLGGVLDPQASFSRACDRVRAVPALAVWGEVGGLVAPMWAAVAAGPGAPHEVVGADFQSPMAQTSESVLAGDRRLRTGLRLAATPSELLAALLDYDAALTPAEQEQLRRFCARPGHRSALASAWPQLAASPAARADTAIARLLRAELGVPAPAGGR
ncbi:MAG: SUMF1/EgtB/PvdO family nonheme iron enzyme [Planctomycetes bacterium]|nr:SUMF1/EgtB/PvdO family nonheme iron enzyme [Planctomycetota bacterium]